MPPRTAASNISTSAQSWSSAPSLRSTDSICPRILFIRFNSLAFPRSRCDIFSPPYTLVGYTIGNRSGRSQQCLSGDQKGGITRWPNRYYVLSVLKSPKWLYARRSLVAGLKQQMRVARSRACGSPSANRWTTRTMNLGYLACLLSFLLEGRPFALHSSSLG